MGDYLFKLHIFLLNFVNQANVKDRKLPYGQKSGYYSVNLQKEANSLKVAIIFPPKSQNLSRALLTLQCAMTASNLTWTLINNCDRFALRKEQKGLHPWQVGHRFWVNAAISSTL